MSSVRPYSLFHLLSYFSLVSNLELILVSLFISLFPLQLCTIKAIQSYFMDSILPPNNLFCKPNSPLFNNGEGSSNLCLNAMSVEDRELLDAGAELGRSLIGAGEWMMAA